MAAKKRDTYTGSVRENGKRHPLRKSQPRGSVYPYALSARRGVMKNLTAGPSSAGPRDDKDVNRPKTSEFEANTCFSMDHKLTPVILRDMPIERCLIDNGATCSLVKERVAKQANCRIDPFTVVIKTLGDSALTTVGCTTANVRTEDLTIELDLLVVSEPVMSYDMVIGKNAVVHGVQILTESDGTTKLRRCPSTSPGNKENLAPLCYSINVGSDDVRDAVEKLLEPYKHMVAKGSPVRRVSTGELKIDLREDKVVNYRPYRLSMSEREKVRIIIDNLLASGVIRESASPFSSPVILVKKKNGDDRLVIDFRAVNKITKKDRYPLPLIDDQLDRLGNAKYFTVLDMTSGFYQIPIAPCSIEKTAFVTPDGHYEFLRMPFGLANAPAVFQRAINVALGKLRNNIALVYLDDILIPSQTVEEGLERLERVLKALDVAGFSLNLEKCSFFMTTIEYLGREVSAQGISPGKVKLGTY